MRLDHIIFLTLLLDKAFCKVQNVLSSKIQPGDNGGGVPPVPIPNTEVKLFSADGTVRSGE